MGHYITLQAEVDIDKSDLFIELSDKDLLNEIKERDLTLLELDLGKEELIDAICDKYNILDSDKIREFFNSLD